MMGIIELYFIIGIVLTIILLLFDAFSLKYEFTEGKFSTMFSMAILMIAIWPYLIYTGYKRYKDNKENGNNL